MGTKLHQEYNADFYAWILHNAALLRAGKVSEIDVENIAEELESMGRSEKREFVNRLAILFSHLLKWEFQPELQGKSWQYTIEEQRMKVIELLEDSQSLKHEIKKKVDYAYKQALILAAKETGLAKKTFPQTCPFVLEDCLSEGFFPHV